MKQLQTAQSLDQTWDANIYFFVVQNGKNLEKFVKLENFLNKKFQNRVIRPEK